ncbi:MAG TPA: hypothetical protein VGQ87_01030 [Patescibacteria group bacterium]|jgi:hypothetical protein|nr:hypothetical protein [Patescibacteria group bacterium]
MAEEQYAKKEQYAKTVCLFLAEQLRVKKIGLKRAADIAQKVVFNINLMDTEADFLRFVKELSKDFDELFRLEDRVFFNMIADERKQMENMVRNFAIQILSEDPKMALDIMLEAIKEESKVETLAAKFPKFNDYIRNTI